MRSARNTGSRRERRYAHTCQARQDCFRFDTIRFDAAGGTWKISIRSSHRGFEAGCDAILDSHADFDPMRDVGVDFGSACHRFVLSRLRLTTRIKLINNLDYVRCLDSIKQMLPRRHRRIKLPQRAPSISSASCASGEGSIHISNGTRKTQCLS